MRKNVVGGREGGREGGSEMWEMKITEGKKEGKGEGGREMKGGMGIWRERRKKHAK